MGHYFDQRHEGDSIDSALATYQNETGTWVFWFPFIAESAESAHPIYNDSYEGGGAAWSEPIRIPVLAAIPYEGTETTDDTGFYTTDRIHLSASAEQLRRYGLGDRLHMDRERLKDRLVYDGVVYDIRSLQTRGQIQSRDFVVGIDAAEVDPAMLVNADRFLQLADPTAVYGEGY